MSISTPSEGVHSEDEVRSVGESARSSGTTSGGRNGCPEDEYRHLHSK